MIPRVPSGQGLRPAESIYFLTVRLDYVTIWVHQILLLSRPWHTTRLSVKLPFLPTSAVRMVCQGFLGGSTLLGVRWKVPTQSDTHKKHKTNIFCFKSNDKVNQHNCVEVEVQPYLLHYIFDLHQRQSVVCCLLGKCSRDWSRSSNSPQMWGACLKTPSIP